MATETMLALAQRVADARREKAQLDAHVKAAREEFAAANAELFAQQNAAAAALTAAEHELRALAEATYKTTGDKKPAPGVAIKVGQALVYDASQALAWAQQSGLALVPESLDVKAFEKIAKATALPFVRYEEKPAVTLATDMDKALAVASVTGSVTEPTPEPATEEAPF